MKKTKTRIVAISDTHRKHNEFSKKFNLPNVEGDILVHTGDIDLHYEDFGLFLGSLPKVKVKIIVPGNHDYIEEVLKYHNPTKGIIVLCNSMAIVNGIRFFGHPWTRCEDSTKMGFGRYPAIPDSDIVLTHSPPKYILDLAWDPRNPLSNKFCKNCNKTHERYLHWGSSSLLKELQRVKPKCSIFGHVHDDPGILKIGDTTFVNATSYCTDFQEPIIFDYVHEEGEMDFKPLKCFTKKYLGMAGKMEDSCAVKWRITKEGYLENDQSTFLNVLKSQTEENAFVLVCSDEKVTKWNYYADNLVLSNGGYVLDNDSYSPEKAILWKSLGSANQKWRFEDL